VYLCMNSLKYCGFCEFMKDILNNFSNVGGDYIGGENSVLSFTLLRTVSQCNTKSHSVMQHNVMQYKLRQYSHHM